MSHVIHFCESSFFCITFLYSLCTVAGILNVSLPIQWKVFLKYLDWVLDEKPEFKGACSSLYSSCCGEKHHQISEAAIEHRSSQDLDQWHHMTAGGEVSWGEMTAVTHLRSLGKASQPVWCFFGPKFGTLNRLALAPPLTGSAPQQSTASCLNMTSPLNWTSTVSQCCNSYFSVIFPSLQQLILPRATFYTTLLCLVSFVF